MKSPLRDRIEFCSGGALKRLIPEESKVSTFLLYGAAMELSLARSGRVVVAHTNKYPVYEFWRYLKEDAAGVTAAANEFYPQIDGEMFYFLQQSWATVGTQCIRSALFFLLNRCSEKGTASMGKIDKSRFNPVALSYLRNFDGENFYPLWDDLENPLDALNSQPGMDYIVIPAGRFNFNLFDYGKSRGYDMSVFNHRELHKRVKEIDTKTLIVYKKHSQLFSMYNDCNIHMVDKYGRFTNKREGAEEMIIANF